MTITTRFAPSPTGYLHIGGARTALFNWLFARHHQGRFLLRIEDTDRARSTDAAIQAIFEGLRWLGLDWDGEAVSQFSRRQRHAEVANALLAEGKAYLCYASQDELAEMRETARSRGEPLRYDGRWRDRDPGEAPAGIKPVVRFKAPQSGETVIEDAIQGRVVVENAQLDDMVLLRSDGTPTYMLSVVVDDIDMEISHVIRGDDHLTNAFRQSQLYRAIGAAPPVFAHIPLIHGPDGAKLSKRHGALGIEAYRDMGYLPEALRNYLLRLGWGHGDDEIISTEQAVEWFTLEAVGRGPARIDFAKMQNLNGHYIRAADDRRLADLIRPAVEAAAGPLDGTAMARLEAGMTGLKQRAKTVNELTDNALFYVLPRPLVLTDKARQILDETETGLLAGLRDLLRALDPWSEPAIEEAVRQFAEAQGSKLGKVAQPLRAALTGSTTSPGVFEVAAVLGREETLGRLDDAISQRA